MVVVVVVVLVVVVLVVDVEVVATVVGAAVEDVAEPSPAAAGVSPEVQAANTMAHAATASSGGEGMRRNMALIVPTLRCKLGLISQRWR